MNNTTTDLAKYSTGQLMQRFFDAENYLKKAETKPHCQACIISIYKEWAQTLTTELEKRFLNIPTDAPLLAINGDIKLFIL